MSGKQSLWLRDYQNTRMDGLRWSLQLTDRTLSGIEKTTLTFQNSEQAGPNKKHPAYSLAGAQIFINTDKVNGILSDRGIATLLGVNYHELAHVVYTYWNVQEIRDTVPSINKTVRANFNDAYNILEEARVESLLAARYPRMEMYFTLAVAEFVVGAPDPSTYLLVHGRKYLPKKIRQMYRDRYLARVGEKKTAEAEFLIDAYRTLVYPADMKKAASIIADFSDLIIANNMGGHSQHGNNSVAGSAGDPKSGKDENEAREEAEKDSKKAEKREEGSDERGDSDESSLPSDQGGGAGPQGDGAQPGDQGSGAVDGDDGDGSQRGGGGDSTGDNGTGADAAGSTAGTGTGKGRIPSPLEVKNALDELVNEILQDSVVQSDIKSSRASMGDLRNGLHSSVKMHSARTSKKWPVTEAMRTRSARYAEALRRIWLAMEPGWVYGSTEGRLDMNRVFSATSPEDLETAYVSWDEGRQHSSKTTGVLISDESGSMAGKVYNEKQDYLGTRGLIAAKNIWEIKRACEEVDIDLAVLTYDTRHKLLYDLGEKVDPDMFFYPCDGGGTNPQGAIVEARRILGQTDTPGKFFINLSDGDWPGKSQIINDSLAAMEDAVKGCGLIGYRSNTSWDYENKFDIVRRSSGDMFGMMSEVVTAIMSRNLEGW